MNIRITKTRDIGTIIKNERKVQKLTQQDLSDLSGVSTHFLSNLENGKESVNIDKVLMVLTTLGLDLTINSRLIGRCDK